MVVLPYTFPRAFDIPQTQTSLQAGSKFTPTFFKAILRAYDYT